MDETSSSYIDIGTAAEFAALAKSGITANPGTTVTGIMGVSPIAGSAGIHGFDLVNDSPAYEYSTSAMVTGKVYAANYKDPTPAKLTKAISHMEAAFTTSMGKPAPDFVEYKTGLLEGSVLVPGLYKWALDISFSTSLTFSGTTSDTWLLQVSRNVYVGVGANVVLAGGAKAINIVWIVQGLVEIGYDSHVEGIFLCATAITFAAGSSGYGAFLSQTTVTLDYSSIRGFDEFNENIATIED